MTSSKKNVNFLANLEQQSAELQEALQQQDNQDAGFAFTSPEEEMTAYLYGLLSDEESRQLETRIQSSPESQRALESARKQHQLLEGCWPDQDVPQDLFRKTLAKLGIDDETDGDNDGPTNVVGTTAC